MNDPFALAAEAAAELNRRTGVERHDVAVVLGCGWRRSVDVSGLVGTEVALADLPGFPPPSAIGHGRTLRSVDVDGRKVILYLGRIHLYEGHDPNVVAHAVRTASAAGCHTVVLTNGAGSLRTEWPIGQPVLISDHINLTGRSPMTGPRSTAPARSPLRRPHRPLLVAAAGACP